MSLAQALTLDFLMSFLTGLSLNVLSAVLTLSFAIPSAFLLGWGMSQRATFVSRPLRAFTKLLHALPVFVAIVFMAGMLPGDPLALGPLAGIRPLVLIVLGCLPYVVATGADQFVAVIARLGQGERRAALLIILAWGRTMQNVISASCFGAVIGVPEAMSVAILTAERLADESARLLFFAIVGLMFACTMQLCVLPFRWFHGWASRRWKPPTATSRSM